MLGPARTGLAGAVLPLQPLGAQRVALRPLPGPLQPPHLARLLHQCCPPLQRGGGVVQGLGLAADGRQLSARTDQGSVRAERVWGTKGGAGTSHRVPASSPSRSAFSTHWGHPTPFLGVQALLPSQPGDTSSVSAHVTRKPDTWEG